MSSHYKNAHSVKILCKKIYWFLKKWQHFLHGYHTRVWPEMELLLDWIKQTSKVLVEKVLVFSAVRKGFQNFVENIEFVLQFTSCGKTETWSHLVGKSNLVWKNPLVWKSTKAWLVRQCEIR